MTKRLDNPKETEWKEIRYHPSPIVTRLSWGQDEFWYKEIPGCKIEVIPEDLGFMKNLVHDIKVKIIYPDDWEEMYAEPLASIHNDFWMFCMDQVIYTVYPFYHRAGKKTSGKLKKQWEIGGKIHSIVAKVYWDNANQYKKYTPNEWAKLLNNILDFIESNKIIAKDDYSNEQQLNKFEENLRNLFKQ